jgi:hypothetical protein
MLASGSKIIDVENAQFNTMVCKGNMNFSLGRKNERKNGGKPLARLPATMPGLFWGEGPGQNRFNVSQRWPASTRKSRGLAFANTTLNRTRNPTGRNAVTSQLPN